MDSAALSAAECRHALGWSKDALAQSVAASWDTVDQWERGRLECPVEVLEWLRARVAAVGTVPARPAWQGQGYKPRKRRA